LPFEILVIGYLIFFALAAPFARVARRKQVGTALAAASVAVTVYIVAHALPLEARLWLPFLYIAVGYWIPVALVPPARGGAFESWLRRTDETARETIGRMPRWLTALLELGYLACFPLVLITFVVVWTAGSRADVAHYWLAVLASGYACYITLPWLVSRPPRLVEGGVDGGAADIAVSTIARLNRFVLGRVSHSLNTFPSGHVAVSVAAAMAAGKVSPALGVIFGAVAAAVALGAVAGRYHYFADVVLGAGVGAAASL
jgi:membrane-associated phospholipid phosphatase